MRLTRYILPIVLLLSFSTAAGRQTDAYVSAVIEHSESQFALGQAYLNNNKTKEAKEAFDKAVDIVLESKVSIKESPRLRSYYLALVEKIYQIEAAGARDETLGFKEQKFEPSPLDELRASVLDKSQRPSQSPAISGERPALSCAASDSGCRPRPSGQSSPPLPFRRQTLTATRLPL